MTVHYRVLTPVQKDGFKRHEAGSLTYFEEFAEAKIAEFLVDGTAEQVDGLIPDVAAPAPVEPQPAQEPAPVDAFTQPAEYHIEYSGQGDPPPDSWAYIWAHQEHDPSSVDEGGNE